MIVMKLSRFAGVSVAGACRRNPEPAVWAKDLKAYCAKNGFASAEVQP